MKNLFKFLVVGGLLVLAACRAAPLENVGPEMLGAPADATLPQVTQAIKQAGAGLGWIMVPDPNKDGLIKGTLHLRRHTAVVDVAFNTKTFTIDYVTSTNLMYDGTRIHKNYNSWVNNLANAIKAQAAAI